MKRDAREAESRASVRLFLMVLAPAEFVVTILGGALLYLFQAGFVYLGALCGMCMRAFALLVWRFRVGPVSSPVNGGKISPFSEVAAGIPEERVAGRWAEYLARSGPREPLVRRKVGSWLN